MGFLDELKDKAEEFGEKAKEGLGAAKDKASGLIEDVKDRFDNDEDETSTGKVDEAVNYDPGKVEAASEAGIAEAAAGVESTPEPSETLAASEPVGGSGPGPFAEQTSEPVGTTDPYAEPASEPVGTTDPYAEPASESLTSEPVGAADAFAGPASDPAAETTEPPTTPDAAYDAVLDDAAKTDEYRSDSTP